MDQRHSASADVLVCMTRIRPQAGVRRSGGEDGRQRVRHVEFVCTVEADPICAVFYREGPAQVTVPATENKLEYARE